MWIAQERERLGDEPVQTSGRCGPGGAVLEIGAGGAKSLAESIHQRAAVCADTHSESAVQDTRPPLDRVRTSLPERLEPVPVVA